jgi:hypothetical protein
MKYNAVNKKVLIQPPPIPSLLTPGYLEMPQSSANAKYIYHLPRTSASFTNLSPSNPGEANNNQSTQTAPLSAKIRAYIPNGPSTLAEYLHRSDNSERIALGQATLNSESSMASKMAAWDARWLAASSK